MNGVHAAHRNAVPRFRAVARWRGGEGAPFLTARCRQQQHPAGTVSKRRGYDEA